MKVGVIQASSQSEKNELLYTCTVEAAQKRGHEVINFGCFPKETPSFSYVEIAAAISLLLSGSAVDFIVTGCSSGQGMMLACNSFPNVICGYAENPQDAYLFGRINAGNAVSLPLGLNFGWAGEINLMCTLEKLFDGPFGVGYPPEDAERKRADTLLFKKIHALAKRDILDVFEQLDEDLVRKVLQKRSVIDYLFKHSRQQALLEFIAQKQRLLLP